MWPYLSICIQQRHGDSEYLEYIINITLNVALLKSGIFLLFRN